MASDRTNEASLSGSLYPNRHHGHTKAIVIKELGCLTATPERSGGLRTAKRNQHKPDRPTAA